jgi:hypothetical protein
MIEVKFITNSISWVEFSDIIWKLTSWIASIKQGLPSPPRFKTLNCKWVWAGSLVTCQFYFKYNNLSQSLLFRSVCQLSLQARKNYYLRAKLLLGFVQSLIEFTSALNIPKPLLKTFFLFYAFVCSYFLLIALFLVASFVIFLLCWHWHPSLFSLQSLWFFIMHTLDFSPDTVCFHTLLPF